MSAPQPKIFHPALSGLAIMAIVICATIATPAWAQITELNMNLEIPIGDLKEIKLCETTNGVFQCNGIATYVIAAYQWLIGAGAILAVLMIMIAGVRWLTAEGSGRVKEAQTAMTNALVGLGLLLGSYLILFVINPDLTVFRPFGLTQIEEIKVKTISTENTLGDVTLAERAGGVPASTGKVPLYKQWDSKWANIQYGNCGGASTIQSSGCGPTSAAMVLSSYGRTVTPKDMAASFVSNGFRVCGSGTAYSAFTTAASLGAYGFTGSQVADKNQIIKHLEKGEPIIVAVGPSIFTGGGHFIVLTGLDTNGNILVNDPNKVTYAGLGPTNSIPRDKIFSALAAAFYVHPK